MARMQLLQRLASTYVLSQCQGSRRLNSSLVRPATKWLNNKDPSWGFAVPQFNSLYDQSVHGSRYYCMKMLHEDDEVSVPKDKATEGKPAKKALDGAAKFNVVRVNDDGSWHHLSLRTSELVSAVILQSFRLPSAYYICRFRIETLFLECFAACCQWLSGLLNLKEVSSCIF